jgi:hypothetical protein
MVNQQFSEVIVTGTKRARGCIIPAHAAVMAILAAEIGNFDHSTEKNRAAKIVNRRFRCSAMQALLCLSANCEQFGTDTGMILHVRGQLRVFNFLSQMKSSSLHGGPVRLISRTKLTGKGLAPGIG